MPHALSQSVGDFTGLTPDIIVSVIEDATGMELLGFTHPLNSYINRVYELQTSAADRIIAKFYRPGRWSKSAILDEHSFVFECENEEIPVVAPLVLKSGTSLGEANGIFFAVYPRRHGRIWEQNCDEDWMRLGMVVARAHLVGAEKDAENRVCLHPGETTIQNVEQLIDGEHVHPSFRKSFEEISARLMDSIFPLFDGCEYIRIHGDCHSKNILHRPGEGLLLIDFDDMVMGPPVQDLWMLLPGNVSESQNELGLILKGYREFRDFDKKSIVLIEPLRAMRMLYFLDWISRQKNDSSFNHNFPNWTNASFWSEEVRELHIQLEKILALG